VGRLALAIADGSSASIESALAILEEPGADGPSLFAHGRAGGVDARTVARLASGHRAYLELLERGPARGESLETFHRRVLAAFDRYRVLCAHRVGPFGSESLARAVGIELGRRARRSSQSVDDAWIGKPVLIVQNSYDTGLFNGDVGIVVRRGDRERAVVFPGPGGEGVRYLAAERLPPHELALATTVHKAQGSQFDQVAFVLPDTLTTVLSREIVYTAVTRARSRVTIVGGRALLSAALALPTIRVSGLADMLWGDSFR
ncbi:MAG: ATP-binding domain-containing protein, partial [Polyangiaceae bacterium]|nr:ATP-binding domain-containing protein [Polyangiaceae bacterium]